MNVFQKKMWSFIYFYTTSLYDLRQLTTALSHTTDILSSIPLVPSGIRVKSSFPTAF